MVTKPEIDIADIDDHLNRDYLDSFRFKRNNENLKRLRIRHEKKQLKFKKQKSRTAIDNNGIKNKTKGDKVFSNYKIDNITRVIINWKESIQWRARYKEILKRDRNKAVKLKQNRNEGAVDIVANKSCLGVDFIVNETHVTNNHVQRRRLKIAKPKIVDPCELGDTNVSLTSEIICDYKRDNFKVVTSPPVFMTNSDDLKNHSEVQKKMVETFNSKDKELLVLENVSEDGDSLNAISNECKD